MSQQNQENQLVRHRYDRIAPFYDWMEWFAELRFSGWRRQLWSRVRATKILEVGVGTGKNMRVYPQQVEITAIDISPKMLERAKRRAEKLGVSVQLELADVQSLPYPDDSFDAAIATFVFCSVPDPVKGLSELHRVLKPGGQLLLLEHVLSHHRLLRPLMKFFNFIPVHIWGANIDRETGENIQKANFTIVEESDLSLDIVKLFEAHPKDSSAQVET